MVSRVSTPNGGVATRPRYSELVGKTALVTGALGGLGRSMVEEFASTGTNVAVHHWGELDKAVGVVADLSSRGISAVAVEGDVSDARSAAAIVEQTLDHFGSIDVLVNNAGYMTSASFIDMPLDHWQKTIGVDLTGVFLVSQAAVRAMEGEQTGVIVNMASQLAFKGARDYVSYCAAKAGVVGLTRAMARELGPRIRVNCIAPGPVLTPMVEPYATPEFVDERTRDLVTRRLGMPDEIAPTVVFLASDGASLIHGQTIHLNGGGVMA